MTPAAAPSLLARWMQRRPRVARAPEPADMGTAFGMEQWLDERDHDEVPPNAPSARATWLPSWLRSAKLD